MSLTHMLRFGHIKLIRAGGTYVLNVLEAVIGTAIFEAEFVDYRASRAVILKTDLVNAAIAFALGYFIYHLWQQSTSKWIWVVGLCWFGSGAFLAKAGGHGAIFWELSRSGSAFDLRDSSNSYYNLYSFYNWGRYTIPLLRTVFFSAGAFCRSSSRTQSRP
jgi:hypothetical protein